MQDLDGKLYADTMLQRDPEEFKVNEVVVRCRSLG